MRRVDYAKRFILTLFRFNTNPQYFSMTFFLDADGDTQFIHKVLLGPMTKLSLNVKSKKKNDHYNWYGYLFIWMISNITEDTPKQKIFLYSLNAATRKWRLL